MRNDIHLVVVQSSDNQRYIFDSIRRVENVGASYLINQVHDGWAREAAGVIWPAVADRWRDWRIETDPAEVVIAGAGGLTALVADLHQARQLVTRICLLALRQAPGLDVCGVVETLDWAGSGSFDAALKRAYARLPVVRETRPGPQHRYARLPLVASCAATGLPAAVVLDRRRGQERRNPVGPGDLEMLSAASHAKRAVFDDALTGLWSEDEPASRPVDGSHRQEYRELVERLEEADWLAVVHADGNGLGEVFTNFTGLVDGQGNREFVDTLRDFSAGVDACARSAYHVAVQHCDALSDAVPLVIPLVLGGDDLTVVCEASVAMALTQRYLAEFARLTAADDRVRGPLAGMGRERLGACAGVAIVKRHYPFHFAYDLVEELVREAKSVKEKLSPQHCAVSFHVLYESAGADLTRLRVVLPDGTALVAQPYVLDDTTPADGSWLSGRRYQDLVDRVAALRATVAGTGERLLPAGSVHDLRESLFLGSKSADARLGRLRGRLGTEAAVALRQLGVGDSLFWTAGSQQVSGLLDALDAMAFMPTNGGEEIAAAGTAVATDAQ